MVVTVPNLLSKKQVECTVLSTRKLGMWFNILINFNAVETKCPYFTLAG